MKRALVPLYIAIFLLMSSVASVYSAPPPLGPPQPRDPISDMGVQGFLTPLVRGKVNEALEAINATASQNPDVRAKVSLSKFNVFGPSLTATQYPDRPNQKFVQVPYMLQFKVHDIQKHTSVGWIGVSAERHISQTINMQVFCDRWHTGEGNLKLVAAAEAPYLENQQSTGEQVVDFFVAGALTNYIDSRVRQQLSGASSATVNLPGKCDALGRYHGQPSDPGDDTIRWSFHPAPKVKVPTVNNEISVTLLSLKRLAARDIKGSPLYQAVEAPALDFYANHQHYYVALQALKEGQQVALKAPSLVLARPPADEALVLIANVIQNVAIGTQPTDSTFRVFGSNVNFGNGTQTIRIQKSYWLPPNPKTGNKPVQMRVDGYELTLQVNAPRPLVSTTSPGGTMTPVGGTRPPGGKTPVVIDPAVLSKPDRPVPQLEKAIDPAATKEISPDTLQQRGTKQR